MLHHEYICAEDGNSETIVMLHGFGGNSRVWKHQVPLLTTHYNVLLIDLPSHHEENKKLSQIEATLESIAQEILAVCDHYGVKHAIFMGVSLGTIFVKYIEAYHSEYVDYGILVGAVATVNCFFRFLAKTFSRIGDKLPFRAVYHIFSWVLMPGKRNEESRSIFRKCAVALNKREFKLYMHIFNQAFAFSRLFEKMKHPENVYISGDEDHVFFKRTRHEARYSAGQFVTVPNCGHVVNIVEKHRFNEMMMEMLQGLRHQQEKLKAIFPKRTHSS